MKTEVDALAQLEIAVVPRGIAQVTRDADDGVVRGFLVLMDCGHEYWTPIAPIWQTVPCAQCINEAVDEVRAARTNAHARAHAPKAAAP